MPNTIEAVVKNGHIMPIEQVDLPEGSRALVTILDNAQDDTWLIASEVSLNTIWENEEDDVYAELLAK